MVGEEDGGTGTLATLLRGHTADGAVVVEPTRLHVVPAQAGSLMFRLVVHGLSAHGCVREEGVNAVEKFVPLLAALRRLEAERCGVPVAGAAGCRPARTRGRRRRPALAALRGVPSAVADRGRHRPRRRLGEQRPRHAGRGGTLRRRRRRGRGRGPAGVRRRDRPRRRGRSLAGGPPARGGVVGRALRPGRHGRRRPDRHDGHRRRGATSPGSAPPVEGVTYGADMRLLVNVGRIPTVLFGPGDVRVAHMPDEYVPIDDLRRGREDARRHGAALLRRARIVPPGRAP